jgi:glycerophosphoryl diester phosphodiesterase
VAPENTLEAVQKAAHLGADAVEIDVQLSADGAVVVIHDDDLVRCTDARQRFPDRMPWRVSDFTAADIRRLDAGGWFAVELLSPQLERQPWLRSLTDGERNTFIQPKDIAHYTSGAVKVPLLDECLQACSDLALAVHIELKAVPRFYPRLAEKVVGQVRESGMQGRVVISSFDHQQLARIAKLAPEVKTAVLSSDRMYRPAEYLARLGASPLEVHYDTKAELASSFRARVLPVTVVIDKNGRERARYVGELDWSAAAPVRFIRQLADD